DSMYPNHPLDMLWQKEKFKGIINIASSPFSDKQRERRGKTLEKVYKHFQVPIVYVNQVGAQTELIFDGGSAVILEDGRMVEGKFFEEGIFYWDTASALTEGFSDYPKKEAIAPVYDALVLGLSDYFKKLGFKKATLGLSGGIDSAVTLAIAADALGSENVYPILLPSEFSSDHSVSDSEKMIQNLGCPFLTIPIKESFDALLNGLRESFAGTEFGLAEENLQARIRGTLLMAVSNKHGHIVLNTSNKSEMAVGFGTLYGDMCGGISVIGDVYKQKVYELARYINRNKETIPQNIIDKAPSAELRPGQLDSDRLPDYEVLDAILELYIEGQQDINAIIKQLKDIDPALIRKTLRLVNINEYKRHQTAPILRVSTKAFGQGRRMPIVAKYLD
ncbi:MAG: NAD(+) synthase, partial [Luteibaculum sp.]